MDVPEQYRYGGESVIIKNEDGETDEFIVTDKHSLIDAGEWR